METFDQSETSKRPAATTLHCKKKSQTLLRLLLPGCRWPNSFYRRKYGSLMKPEPVFKLKKCGKESTLFICIHNFLTVFINTVLEDCGRYTDFFASQLSFLGRGGGVLSAFSTEIEVHRFLCNDASVQMMWKEFIIAQSCKKSIFLFYSILFYSNLLKLCKRVGSTLLFFVLTISIKSRLFLKNPSLFHEYRTVSTKERSTR